MQCYAASMVDIAKKASKGGLARKASLSPQRRQEIATAAAEKRWGTSTPRATHEGVLRLGQLELQCYVLETGQRVLSGSGMLRALDLSPGTNKALGGNRLSNFAAGKLINQFIPGSLQLAIENPLKFRALNGGALAHGYDANTLVDFCEAVLRLREARVMQKQQEHIAERCELLMRGLARVGITALVDEATGYQDDRARDALAKILEAFIAKELRPWVKTFPTDYYKELFRLRGWVFPPKDNPQARPPLVGKITNWIVYDRLAPGVLYELRRVADRDDQGRLKHKLHQRLTDEHGHPKLTQHLAVVVAMMKVSKNYDDFLHKLDVVAPKFGNTIEMDLGLEE